LPSPISLIFSKEFPSILLNDTENNCLIVNKNMKLYKIAFTPDQNRKKIDSNERDIKDLKKDTRDLTRDVKKLNEAINSLNMGQRRFWQQTTVFTSVQRKLERLEKLEIEWNKYKNEMDTKIKKLIEQKSRASI